MTRAAHIDQPTRSVDWVRVDAVSVDHRYQRPLDLGRVEKIARELDLDAIGIPLISRRGDGSCWYIDGQTRAAALIAAGLGDSEIQMEVRTGLTLKQEAAEYLLRNDSKALTPVNRFRAAVTNGDKQAVAVDRLVKRYGLVVGQKANNSVTAITSLLQVWEKDNGLTAERVLHVLTRAYGPIKPAVAAGLLEGMGLFLFRYGERIDLDSLADRMAREPGKAPGLLGNARTFAQIRRTRVGDGVADLVTQVYNKHPRKADQKLPDWQVVPGVTAPTE